MSDEVRLRIEEPKNREVFNGATYNEKEKMFYVPLSYGPWIADDEFMTAREELYEELEEIGADPCAVTVWADPTIKAEDWAQHVCDYVLDGEAETTETYVWPQPVTEPGECHPVIKFSLESAIKLFGDAKEPIRTLDKNYSVEGVADDIHRVQFDSTLACKYSADDMEVFISEVLARYLRINGYDYDTGFSAEAMNWDTFTSSVYEMEFHGDTVEQCTAKITSPELIPQSLMAEVQELCDTFSE